MSRDIMLASMQETVILKKTQKEETEKHSAGFGDLLKGWFKK